VRVSRALGPTQRPAAPGGTHDAAAGSATSRPWPAPERATGYALVLVLSALLALWGSFLVPFRVAGALVPVSWAVALVGNVALGRAAGRLAGSGGVLAPAALWLLIAFTLASRRTEGDVVVPGTVVGLGFLLLGAVGSALAYGRAVLHRGR